MNRVYKTVGINLKGVPFGEQDRLITILTPDYGIVKAIAPGARKYKSKLRGRSELFVINQLEISRGKSLHRILQAETLQSYPKLSQDLGKLTASQYLAELVLQLAPDSQPQPEFYQLLTEHLRRLEQLNLQGFEQSSTLFAHLSQGIFHLLAIAGIAPQVHQCYMTQKQIQPPRDDLHWRVGFSFEGGVMSLKPPSHPSEEITETEDLLALPPIHRQLSSLELFLLQQLGEDTLPLLSHPSVAVDVAWVKLELLLRHYSEYHCGRELRSAKLMDALSPLEF